MTLSLTFHKLKTKMKITPSPPPPPAQRAGVTEKHSKGRDLARCLAHSRWFVIDSYYPYFQLVPRGAVIWGWIQIPHPWSWHSKSLLPCCVICLSQSSWSVSAKHKTQVPKGQWHLVLRTAAQETMLFPLQPLGLGQRGDTFLLPGP